MYILTPEQIRSAENDANVAGLSFFDMMENAGRGCAEFLLAGYSDKSNFTILCGKGKNGGDGYVIARHLFNSGKNVSVISVLSGELNELTDKMKALLPKGVRLVEYFSDVDAVKNIMKNSDVYVEAIFGIGFKGSLPSGVKDILSLRESGVPTISIDIPAGLSADNENTDFAVRADETLSMLCLKKEHIYKPYCDFCGKVTVIPIGFSLCGSFPSSFTSAEIKNELPPRNFDSNKGSFGRPLLVAGSVNMTGAAVFAAKGVVSSGAGNLFLSSPEQSCKLIAHHFNECIFIPLPSTESGYVETGSKDVLEKLIERHEAIAVGCGLGTGEGAYELVCWLIKNYKGMLIIDADGINCVSRNIHILKEAAGTVALTPHPLEMSRLTGLDVEAINANREKTATEFAQEFNVTVLLKGANTVIASPNGNVYINPTGSTALSRGGSGDLLTGICVSLCGQGLTIEKALAAGAYIHGLAGEIAEEKFTAYSSTISRIAECIPEAFLQIIKGS